MSTEPLTVPSGVYVPIPSFFMNERNGDPDTETTVKHIERWVLKGGSYEQLEDLVRAGVQGIIVNSYIGEGSLVRPSEWKGAIETAAKVVKPLSISLCVDCSAPSLWLTCERITIAHGSGADFVFVLPPSTYSTDLLPADYINYFTQVAAQSPVPVVIYEWPDASGGIKLGESIVDVVSAHKNIAGMACAVNDGMRSVALWQWDENGQRKSTGSYVQKKAVVSGIANIVPASVTQMYPKEGWNIQEQRLQAWEEAADPLDEGGIPALKATLMHLFNYGGTCRDPLPAVADGSSVHDAVYRLQPALRNEEGVIEKDKRAPIPPDPRAPRPHRKPSLVLNHRLYTVPIPSENTET